MDEKTFERTERFDCLRENLEAVIRGLIPSIPDLSVLRAAAE
jgi:hypothetical protein